MSEAAERRWAILAYNSNFVCHKTIWTLIYRHFRTIISYDNFLQYHDHIFIHLQASQNHFATAHELFKQAFPSAHSFIIHLQLFQDPWGQLFIPNIQLAHNIYCTFYPKCGQHILANINPEHSLILHIIFQSIIESIVGIHASYQITIAVANNHKRLFLLGTNAFLRQF